MEGVYNNMLKINVCLFLLMFFNNNSSNDMEKTIFLHGKVQTIISDTTDEENFTRNQEVKIRITDKNFKNKIITVQNIINLASVHKIIVKEGDSVILAVIKSNNKLTNFRIYSYNRDHYLLYLLALFVGSIFLFGGRKGFPSIISLVITILLIFVAFFKMILNNINPIAAVCIIALACIIITFFIISESNSKTYAAILGAIGGVIVTGLLTYYFGTLIKIQGVTDENIELISYMPKGSQFNYIHILYAGIILGAIGAIMDVCMSIASTMDEIYTISPKINNFDLFVSGVKVGKDIMGTMSNTLILAYAGSSMSMILVFYLYKLSFVQFINTEQIAAEVLRSFCGSIGLIFSIPLTALFYIILKKKKLKKTRYSKKFIKNNSF